jgi:hypothetical protein
MDNAKVKEEVQNPASTAGNTIKKKQTTLLRLYAKA